MQTTYLPKSAVRALLVTALVSLLSLTAQAATIFTLKGVASDARQDSDAEVRVSLLSWSSPEQNSAVVQGFKDYKDKKDVTAFRKLLEAQETQGYLFTQAATGYTIKYAWLDPASKGKHMVWVVVPALKTINPYMWKNPNKDESDFSVVEVRSDGEAATAKISGATPATVSDAGVLQLQDFGSAATFASLHDNTPYYLKKSG